MKKLNRRGVVTVLTVFLWYGASIIVGAAALTPSFREKKAIEYCQQEGESADACKERVSGMTKPQVLAYIRDTAERPRP